MNLKFLLDPNIISETIIIKQEQNCYCFLMENDVITLIDQHLKLQLHKRVLWYR